MPKKILVIDDEIFILKFMNNLLTSQGYTVLIASNGLEGIDLAKKEKPDLVITDVRMPIMTGYKVVEELRADEQFKNVPIVIVTGYAIEEEDRVKAKQLGVTEFFLKPIEFEDILTTLSKLLGTGKS